MDKREKAYVYPELHGTVDEVCKDIQKHVKDAVPEEYWGSVGIIILGDGCVEVLWSRPMTESEILKKEKSDAALRERRIAYHKEELRKLESS